MSWIDRMEMRLGLRQSAMDDLMEQNQDADDLTPEEWEAVIGFSSEAVSMLDTMKQHMPEIFNDPKVAEAARRVVESHEQILAKREEEDGHQGQEGRPAGDPA